MTLRSSAAVAALAAGILLFAVPVQAQSTSPAPQAQQQPTLKLDDAKLDAFVGAAVEVIRIRQTWKPKIDGAKSLEEKQQLNGAAQIEMKLAVENAPGITMKEYVIIAEASRQNSRLLEEIQRRVGQRIGPANK